MSDEIRKKLLEGAEDIQAYGGVDQFQVCDCGLPEKHGRYSEKEERAITFKKAKMPDEIRKPFTGHPIIWRTPSISS